MKKLILSALVLALTGGAAMADRGHGGGRSWGGGRASGGVVVHEHDGFHGEARGGGWRGHEGYEHRGWNGGGRVYENRGWNGGGRVYVNNGWRGEPRYYHTYGHARANIWLPRPVIREHYYNYGYRPSLFVEDYGYREGYIFVRGNWQWNGYEWIWMPGHYEPDPAFVEVY